MELSKIVEQLCGTNPIEGVDSLTKKLKSLEEPKEFICKLIISLPKCNDIIKLLDGSVILRKDVAKVFDLLGFILVGIADDEELQSIGFHIAKVVLASHTNLLMSLLNSSNNTFSNTAALRFMTGVVANGPAATFEMFAHIQLSDINFQKFAKPKEDGDKDVRANLFCFILAFLNLKDNGCLKRFLQNAETVTCLFKELHLDPCDMVIKLLNLLHEAAVMNSSISKTMKTTLFNRSTCKPLMGLYFNSPTKTLFSERERERIKGALHPLMVTLFSDLKYGVVFRSKYDENMEMELKNQHAFLMLQTLYKPWTFEEGYDLVCKLLISCPDLTRNIAEFLYLPRESLETKDSFYRMKLLARLTMELDFWTKFESQLQNGNFDPWFSYFPFYKFSLICLLMESFSCIKFHSGVLMLLSVARRSKEALKKIDCLVSVKPIVKTQCKVMILNFIESLGCGMRKLVPQFDFCLSSECTLDPHSWYTTEYPSKFGLLADFTQLICLFLEILGFFKTKDHIDPIYLLQQSQTFSSDEINMDPINHQKFLKAILQLIFVAQEEQNFHAFGYMKDSSEKNKLVANEKFFLNLICIYCYSKSIKTNRKCKTLDMDLCEDSLALLNASLEHWGLFSFCENDIVLWLNKILRERKEHAEFLARTVSLCINNLFIYCHILMSLNKNEVSRNSKILEEIDNFSLEADSEVVSVGVSFPFSCLILGAIDSLKSDPHLHSIEYFSDIIGDSVHRVQCPEALSSHLLQHQSFISERTKQYLTVWASGEKRPSSSVNSSDMDVLSKLKAIFMSGTVPKFSSFWNDVEDHVEVLEVLISCTSLLLAFIKFELKKNISKRDLKWLKFLRKMFRALINIPMTKGRSENYADFIEFLLKHPFIIERYNPLSDNNDDVIKKEIESIISVTSEHYTNLHHLLEPYIDVLVKFVASVTPQTSECWSPTLLSYSFLTYSSIEQMVTPLLIQFSLPCSSTYMQLLCDLLEVLLKCSPGECSQVPSKKLAGLMFTKFIYILKRKENAIEEESLHVCAVLSEVLSKSPQIDAKECSEDVLDIIIQCKPFCANVCCNLISIHPHIAPLLAKKLNDVDLDFLNQASCVLALMKQRNISADIMHSLMLKIKQPILSWCSNSQSMEDEVHKEIMFYMLRDKVFEKEELHKICNILYEDVISSDGMPPSHLFSVAQVFEHLAEEHDGKNSSHPHLQLLSILLRAVAKLYKTNLVIFLKQASKLILEVLLKVDSTLVQKHICTKEILVTFTNRVLKYSLSDYENGAQLLKCLVHLTKTAYSKKHHRCLIQPSTLYSMIKGHSLFLSLLLSTDYETQDIKEQLALLQLAVVECHPKVCEERDVPVLLGSYGATKSMCDQTILKILHLYEQHGFMPNIEPLVWGEVAISLYAVKDVKDEAGGDKYRSPTLMQILPLIDEEKVFLTAFNFDMKLGLEPTVLTEGDSTLYDQRYLLPLFLYISEDFPEADAFALIKKGVLAIGIAALSSHCDEVWKAGATLLKYIVTLLMKYKHQNRTLLWIWLVAVIGYGLESRVQRIPSLIVHFLIKTSQLLLSPADRMYRTLMNYLYLKPALPLFKVPEQHVLFFSCEVSDHFAHRKFLLKLLSSGVRDGLDIKVCNESHVPKLVLALLTTSSRDFELMSLAFDVLKTMSKVPEGAKSLVSDHGLLIDLPLVLKSEFDFSFNILWINDAVEILSSLWDALEISVSAFFTSTQDPKKASENNKKREVSANSSPNRMQKKRRTSKSQEGVTHSTNNSLPKDGKDLGQCTKEKERNKFLLDSQFIELLTCLGRIVPKVVSYGNKKAVYSCFFLLNKIILVVEEGTLFFPSLKHPPTVKKQIESWIDKTTLLERFSEDLPKNNSFFYINDSNNSRKTYFKNNFNEDLFESITGKSDEEIDLGLMTKKLFCSLNSTRMPSASN